MATAFSELLRVDPLTGCKNYLGFLETLTSHSISVLPANGRSKETVENARINATQFSGVLFIAMNHMRAMNATQGRAYGDSAIRWMGILLREECNTDVYRVGGIEFAVLLKLNTREEQAELIERVLGRMEQEASSFDFPGPAADIALVSFDQSPNSLDTILLKMGEAMVRVKNSAGVHFLAFEATDFTVHAQAPEKWWEQSSETDVPFAVRWISIVNILQVLEMGRNPGRDAARGFYRRHLQSTEYESRHPQAGRDLAERNHKPQTLLDLDDRWRQHPYLQQRKLRRRG